MYESYYGFKEKPFNLTPDPDYLFMSHGHEETYTHLKYAIMENKGFVVITGEIGSGKTTLINYLLRKLHQNIQIAVINQTLMQPKQFIKMLCQEFEINVDGKDKAAMLDSFHSFLLTRYAERKRVALIIDESQNLPDKTIEEIRMLSNLESEKQHLIQILLIGQPELKYKLQRKSLEQFIQRVTVYWHLDALNVDEVNQYIRHRLWIAVSENLDIFNPGAIAAIHKHSRGIPRLINILCDAALIHGYADDIKVIDANVIEDVVNMKNIGGILSGHNDPDEEKTMLPPKKEVYDQLHKRIQHLEKKMSTLEKSLGDITNNHSSNNNRDELVLELTKMLKQSMQSQANLMLEVIELRHGEKGGEQ